MSFLGFSFAVPVFLLRPPLREVRRRLRKQFALPRILLFLPDNPCLRVGTPGAT
jgi:hypothetical protein